MYLNIILIIIGVVWGLLFLVLVLQKQFSSDLIKNGQYIIKFGILLLIFILSISFFIDISFTWNNSFLRVTNYRNFILLSSMIGYYFFFCIINKLIKKEKITVYYLKNSLVLWTILMGYIITIYSNNLLITLIGLEIINFSILAFLRINNSLWKLTVETLIKLFLINSFITCLLLFSFSLIWLTHQTLNYEVIFLMNFQNLKILKNNILFIFGIFLLISSFLIKIGYIPYHFWIVDSYNNLNYISIFILLLFNKFIIFQAFIIILYSCLGIFILEIFFFYLKIIIFFSLIFSLFFIFSQNKILKFLIYTSIINYSLVLLLYIEGSTIDIVTWALFYNLIYIFFSFLFIQQLLYLQVNYIIELKQIFLKNNNALFYNMSLIFLVLNLAGFPPFPLFWGKLIIFFNLINNLKTNIDFLFLILFFILIVCIFFFYFRFLKIIFFENLLSEKFSFYRINKYSFINLKYSIFLSLCFFFSFFFFFFIDYPIIMLKPISFNLLCDETNFLINTLYNSENNYKLLKNTDKIYQLSKILYEKQLLKNEILLNFFQNFENFEIEPLKSLYFQTFLIENIKTLTVDQFKDLLSLFYQIDPTSIVLVFEYFSSINPKLQKLLTFDELLQLIHYLTAYNIPIERILTTFISFVDEKTINDEVFQKYFYLFTKKQFFLYSLELFPIVGFWKYIELFVWFQNEINPASTFTEDDLSIELAKSINICDFHWKLVMWTNNNTLLEYLKIEIENLRLEKIEIERIQKLAKSINNEILKKQQNGEDLNSLQTQNDIINFFFKFYKKK